jgi:hypothetical protein
MPLDLARLLPQIDLMSEYARGRQPDYNQRLKTALAKLDMHAEDVTKLRDRIVKATTGHTSTWLMAGIMNGIGGHHAADPCPPDFTIAAADGSHIDVDRHHSARCVLINTSQVIIRYGTHPDADIVSWPDLYFEDDSLRISPTEGKQPPMLLQGPLLGVKRSIEECRRLADAAEADQSHDPILALLDGSLTLWSLGGKDIPDYVREAMLGDGLLLQLGRLQAIGQRRPLGVASFISFPRSTDVANSLRVSFCPYDKVDCDVNCSSNVGRPCLVMDGITDRDLFESYLKVNERSDVFASLSSIVTNYYKQHAVFFFYLRLEEELARVEIPSWVAGNPNILSLTHSILLDQCRRGLGYPVALGESHEAAVLGGPDRDLFWQLVNQTLNNKGMHQRISAKSQSKRTRSI